VPEPPFAVDMPETPFIDFNISTLFDRVLSPEFNL
jgi:hypothetical protein